MSDSISTLAELKAASQTPTAARNRLTYLFDEGKFTELDAYAAAGDSLAGVITAFGYVEGNPVYAFSQDVTVKDGGGAGRPAAPQGLHPGVKTDSRRNILGIILAAAAAILCTIIDQVMKEE